jgi:type IV fimbrial biogenesis protein FimT
MYRKPLAVARNGKSRSLGFSLIELLVSIAILGVLASLAAPSFSESIKRYRINAIREDLSGSIQLARAEAVRRGRPVALIRELTCAVTLANANDWSCGWRMVVDSDSGGTISDLERGTSPVDATRVLQTTTISNGYKLTHGALGESLVFNVWGQATVSGQFFTIAPPEGTTGDTTSTLCFNSGGRIRSLKGDVTCP